MSEFGRLSRANDGFPESPWALAEEITVRLQNDAGPEDPEMPGRPEFRDISVAKVLRMAKHDRETLIALYARYEDSGGSYRIHPAKKLVNALNGQ